MKRELVGFWGYWDAAGNTSAIGWSSFAYNAIIDAKDNACIILFPPSSLHRLVYDLLLHQANSVLVLSFLGLQLQLPLPKLFLLAFEVFLLGPELSLQFLKTSLILIDHFEFNLSDVDALLFQVLTFALQAVKNCLFSIFELVQPALVLLLHLTHPEQILILVFLLYFILHIHL